MYDYRESGYYIGNISFQFRVLAYKMKKMKDKNDEKQGTNYIMELAETMGLMTSSVSLLSYLIYVYLLPFGGERIHTFNMYTSPLSSSVVFMFMCVVCGVLCVM